jgi:hypothetical protein
VAQFYKVTVEHCFLLLWFLFPDFV